MITKRTQNQINRVVLKFVNQQPRNLEDVENMGYTLKPIGDGAYRRVYKVGNLPIVVKVPYHTGGSCRRHSIAEWRAVKRIDKYKKYVELKPFVPTIYYCDQKTGIMIVHYYKPAPLRFRKAVAKLFEVYLPKIWPHARKGKWATVDIHSSNVGIDEDGIPKVIDLGYFSEYGKK